MCQNGYTKPCDYKGCIGQAHCRDYPSYCKLHDEAVHWFDDEEQYNIVFGGDER